MFLHVNLCILIRIEEKDKNVNDFILKIKEFKKKIADSVKYSLWCGFSEMREWESNYWPFEGRNGKALNNFALFGKNNKNLLKGPEENELKKAWNNV